jgi:hypothetical protein
MAKKPRNWYEQIAIRPAIDVERYERHQIVCGHVADVFFSLDEEILLQRMRQNTKDSINITAYTLYKVGEAKCPTYWVNGELLSALMKSELSVEIDSLNWAMKTGIMMLPKGAVIAPSQNSVSCIYWHYDDAERLLYWTATDGDNFFCRRFTVRSGAIEHRAIDIEDDDDYNPQTIIEINDYLQSLFLRLILIMECRPELVETEAEIVRINQGFSKAKEKEFYQPLWIGKNYSIKKDVQDKGGTHSSPRVHWRRGFLRNQPYGEGRQLRKLVWIEPVLVMGGG